MGAPKLRTAVLSVIGVIAACSPEPVGGPSREPPARPDFEITTSCGAGITVAGLNRNWTCGDKIRFAISGATTDEINALNSAAGLWNGAVLGAHNLPQFNATGSNKTVTVTFTGTGDYYCGQVPTPTQLNVARSATAGCTNPGRLSTGTVDNLLLHELSHVVGFQSNVWHKPSDIPHTGHCASALYSSTRPLNSGVCQHEIEAIQARYGLRSTAPNLFKHVMTGLQGLTNLTLAPGTSGTLRVTFLQFRRANGSMCGEPDTSSSTCTAPTTDASLSWSVPTGGSLITLSGSGASRTVTAGNTAGTATVKVSATTSIHERAASFGDPGTGTTSTVTIQAQAPAGPPSNLAITNITATSAKLTWTSADSYSSTVVRRRLTGQGAFQLVATVAAGTSTYTLTGLHCATTYDVELYHTNDGVASTSVAQAFTTGACTVSTTINPPSGVVQTNCTPSTSGGKSYATYTLSWTAGSNPSSSVFQVGSALSNSPGSAVVIRVGPISTRSADVGPYLVTSTSSPRYFWVRHANGAEASSWVALQGNPIQIKNGCLL